VKGVRGGSLLSSPLGERIALLFLVGSNFTGGGSIGPESQEQTDLNLQTDLKHGVWEKWS